jgi:hypothetical protein
MAKKRTNHKQSSTAQNLTTKPRARRTRTKKSDSLVKATKSQAIKFIARPLCFTTSYNRPVHLYHCINNILNNQSYKDIKYVVGICIDNSTDQENYNSLLKDFLSDKRLSIFYHKNMDQHDNYLYPIKKIDYHKYNLFIKIDDDDIYKHEYINNTIQHFSKNKTDILSSQLQYQIEGNKLVKGSFDIVGSPWGPDTASNIKFGMPCTYAFNNKALDIISKLKTKDNHKIHPFEDPVWRTKWREKNLSSHIIKQSIDAIYNIHEHNVSCPIIKNNKEDHNTYKNIENDFCSICLFEHHYWQSFVILNKRNNRMYNIDNDDHGVFEYLDDGNIKIIWDEWGEEIFYKKYIDHNYYYSIK